MANSPTAFVDATTVAAREAEVPNANFQGGMNGGGSNMGIGIATGQPDLSGDDASWTLNDQDGAARTPQASQYIGGNAYGDGIEGKGTVPVSVATPSITGDGTYTDDGDATLASLAAGWTAV